MIKWLNVEHYKSIESLHLDLGSVNLLVGPNSTGKSNILDSMRFLKDAVRYGLDRAVSDRHGIDSIRQWSPSRPYNVLLSVGIEYGNSGHGHYSLTLSSSKGNFRIIKEEGTWHDKTEILVEDDDDEDDEEGIISGRKIATVGRKSRFTRDGESKATVAVHFDGYTEEVQEIDIEYRDDLFLNSYYGSRVSSNAFAAISAIRRALSDFEAYSIFPNTLRTPQTPSNETRLSPNGDNLTSVFKLMTRSKSGEDARSEIISLMKLIMPNLESISIQSLGGLMVPLFKVREITDKAHVFNVSQISDGTLRLLGILTTLYHPNRPSVIGLEEPEQAINPGMLAVVAEAVHEIGKKTQIFLTTHSPNLVDHFEPEEIVAVTMNNGITNAGRINPTQSQAVKDRLMTLAEIMVSEGITHQ